MQEMPTGPLMFHHSSEASEMPLSRPALLQLALFSVGMICSDLQSFPNETLVINKFEFQRIISHHTDNETFANQSDENRVCSNSYSEVVRICSMPSKPQDYGNTRMNDRVLVFKINNYDIKIFIKAHHITLPNATISYHTVGDNELSIYHQDISENLYVFYMGSFVFLGFILPFTAEWGKAEFVGKTSFGSVHFDLHCSSVFKSSFYKSDHCFYCHASCTVPASEPEGNDTMIDYQDLFDISIPYLELQNYVLSLHHKHPKNTFLRRPRSVPYSVPRPVSCVLHIVADYLFYKYIGGGSVMETVNIMLSIINDADALFRSTDFDGDDKGDNLGFLVGKVTVFRDEHDPDYRLLQPHLTSAEYLATFSLYDFSGFCLGLGFTYRDFHGVGGSAYPGHSDPLIPGGLCQGRLKMNDEHISFNTVVVTFLANGRKMGQRQVVLILAHELGHSLGAKHDVTKECHPGGRNGNFIMSSTTNHGKHPNNQKFSKCSIQSMLPVIKKKGVCLIYSYLSPLCGNSVPEAGEECDCGASKNCNEIDPCCTPADAKGDLDTPCMPRRSQGKLCSPKVSPCCTDSCTFISGSEGQVCKTQDDCSQVPKCTGQSAHCPTGRLQPNGTLCNNYQGVCRKGKCSESVCEYHKLMTCNCKNVADQCKLCCREPTSSICRSADTYGIVSANGRVIYHDIGAPCFDYGICDSKHVCHSPFHIPKPSFQLLGFSSRKEFLVYVKNYWFYYVFASFCVLFTMIILMVSYYMNDDDYLKALRYGKMLAIFAIGEHQTKLYRKLLFDIDDYYTFKILQVQRFCEASDLVEAIARLKLLFPEASVPYLSRIAKISAAERVAVKILLLQGFRLRTFTKYARGYTYSRQSTVQFSRSRRTVV